MFTVDEVNQEIKNYIKYTLYNVPQIQEVVYTETKNYYGEEGLTTEEEYNIKRQELLGKM